jgi:redox-sensitive bicupin YhaK (pirin superfamily)
MMLQVRKNHDRGRADYGWVRSQYGFSFGDYFDVAHSGFGPLVVLNEDQVSAGRGFGTHSHRNMEIISYVLAGELAHQDNLGNSSVMRYGDVQCMSAGTGIKHSEFNQSGIEPLHFLQIWIEPSLKNLAPIYDEKYFDPVSKRGKLCLIASQTGCSQSVIIHQDVAIYASIVGADDRLRHELRKDRNAYVHVVRGTLMVNGVRLFAGDALKAWQEEAITLSGTEDAEILLFDLPS